MLQLVPQFGDLRILVNPELDDESGENAEEPRLVEKPGLHQFKEAIGSARAGSMRKPG